MSAMLVLVLYPPATHRVKRIAISEIIASQRGHNHGRPHVSDQPRSTQWPLQISGSGNQCGNDQGVRFRSFPGRCLIVRPSNCPVKLSPENRTITRRLLYNTLYVSVKDKSRRVVLGRVGPASLLIL